MHILLIEQDVRHIAPNIALMKWARWAELNGHTYKYIVGKKDFLKKSPDLILTSLVFSFYSKEYADCLRHYKNMFPSAKFLVGGAFPTLNKDWFTEQLPFVDVHEGMHNDIENLAPKYSIDPLNKKIIGYASRGCTNKCGYCMVSKLEGPMKSFSTIRPMLENGLKEIDKPNGVVLYDNNFTAHEHFDDICDELEEFNLGVDIHGLHVNDFTDHHAERFARLKWKAQKQGALACLRFSFDFLGYEKHILRALKLVEKHKIKANFFCYMLYNFMDTPADFWKRIELAQNMVDEVGRKIILFPQRYQPLDALIPKTYISPKWPKETLHQVDSFFYKTFPIMHGFIQLTPDHAVQKFIGNSKEEFFDVIKQSQKEMIKNYQLIKKPKN